MSEQSDLGKNLRIGIDLGGTKIEGVALAAGGIERARRRSTSPRAYAETIAAIRDMTLWLEEAAGGRGSVGIGMPGSLSPVTRLVQNANSTWLNGQAFDRDLEEALGRPVRLANDANCFALSEAIDGAGAGRRSVFGVILGTGCGGGLVYDRRPIDGPRGIAGEWGHNPLPWASPDEHPGPRCWCGRRGCLETWVSGPALAADYFLSKGEALSPEAIVMLASEGDEMAKAALDRHTSRLARGLAHVINLFDPEVVVLGGGLSKLQHLYEVLPGLIAPHIFAAEATVTILPPRWGDTSGVRGAAWLWPADIAAL